MGVYSIHSLRCEHAVMSAQGIDLGQENPHGWRREPMGMTQEVAEAAGKPWPLQDPGEPSLREFPSTSLSRSIPPAQVPAGAEPGPSSHLPQLCSCSPAPAALLSCAWSSPGTSRRAAVSQEGGTEAGSPAE